MRIAFLVALAVLVSGCASGVGRPVHEITARVEPDSVQRVRVVAHTYWYEPNRIVIRARIPVELTVHDASWFVPHSFVCIAPEGGLNVNARLGMIHRTKKVRFVPAIPGEYPFFCGVDGHAKHGMKGTLVVRD
ncbi:MAG TPA: cupredoxin domain-containing protein [Terriglobales bacterium]|nr:cupredoxin domain-containing protein [Terriglobales bacterium]